jgi:hypothetical protein
LSVFLPMRFDEGPHGTELVVPNFRHAFDGPVGELRGAVMDVETYRWRMDGRSGAFVRLIEYRGDALVYSLSPYRVIERWPESADLGWQVRGFLLGLAKRGAS